jgi:imidazolonepropionase-like amidohydrolase
MGRAHELGHIGTGYLADILVLDGDPLADIRHLRKPAVIIRGGAVYNP